MKQTPSQRGFTLIELLVVISIISLLAVALLPQIVESKEKANMAADKSSLTKHYNWIQLYKDRFKAFPRGGGHRFVLDTWVRGGGVMKHTPENRDAFFSRNIQDGYLEELRDREPREIWKSLDEVSSEDTHFAGRSKRFKKGKLDSGYEIWMATDNEGVSIYDKTVLALFGNGAVRELTRGKDLKDEWFEEDTQDGEAFVFPVGPESPHKDLKKLDY